MNLARLVFYSSNLTNPGRIAETIQGILLSCTEPGLTGTIMFSDRYFLQAMEGSRSAISSKLGDMFADTRQKNLTLLSMSDVAERKFPNWLVAFAAQSAELQALYIRFGSAPIFEPPLLSPCNAEGLLSELWRTESRFITRSTRGASSRIESIPHTSAVVPSKDGKPATAIGRPPSDTFLGPPASRGRGPGSRLVS